MFYAEVLTTSAWRKSKKQSKEQLLKDEFFLIDQGGQECKYEFKCTAPVSSVLLFYKIIINRVQYNVMYELLVDTKDG